MVWDVGDAIDARLRADWPIHAARVADPGTDLSELAASQDA